MEKKKPAEQAEAMQPETEVTAAEETASQAEPEAAEPADSALTELQAKLDALNDKHLRMAAEYDNFRKRSQREREAAHAEAVAYAVKALLPTYDNLERALKAETADAEYKKGVEMTMTQLRSVLEKLGITEIPALGQPFDPTLHNAVMHVEDESLGENTVAEVFQAGFKLGDKVIRFSMVKVAN